MCWRFYVFRSKIRDDAVEDNLGGGGEQLLCWFSSARVWSQYAGRTGPGQPRWNPHCAQSEMNVEIFMVYVDDFGFYAYVLRLSTDKNEDAFTINYGYL